MKISKLYSNKTPCTKKTPDFDVTLGCSTERTCANELVFSFCHSYNISARMWACTGTMGWQHVPCPQGKQKLLRKRFARSLKQSPEKNYRCKQENHKLHRCHKSDSFKPYRKPNKEINYIKHGNQPPPIIKDDPKSINKRICRNSKSAKIFNQHFDTYAEALKKREHNSQAKFGGSAKKNNRKDIVNKRKRKVTWFDPSFNINVSTSVAEAFLSLIDKHFHKSNKLHERIN